MPKPIARWFLSPAEKAEYVRVRLDRWEKLFAVRQNPKFAWRAYQLAREAGWEIPDWVLRSFDFGATNLNSAYDVKEGEIARRVTEAMGFVPGGTLSTYKRYVLPELNESTREKPGAFNPFGESTEERQLRLSEDVEMFQQAGMTFREAKRETAKTRDVTIRTVERALQTFPIKKRDT
jgi:hypothetical protein